MTSLSFLCCGTSCFKNDFSSQCQKEPVSYFNQYPAFFLYIGWPEGPETDIVDSSDSSDVPRVSRARGQTQFWRPPPSPFGAASVPSPREAFMGLALPNKAPRPPHWNMKHYISAVFLSICGVSSPPVQTQSPPAETQSPLVKTFWRRFWAA